MPSQNMKSLDTTIDELDAKRRSIAEQQKALKQEGDKVAEAMLKLYNDASVSEKAYIRRRLKRIKQDG